MDAFYLGIAVACYSVAISLLAHLITLFIPEGRIKSILTKKLF